MDEAERCHEVGYLAGGRLLIHGGVDEVLDQSGLATFEVAGPGLEALAAQLRAQPGIEMTPACMSAAPIRRCSSGASSPFAPTRASAGPGPGRASRMCSSTRWRAPG
jgi:ABC-2 type transport system ATP-binding protein